MFERVGERLIEAHRAALCPRPEVKIIGKCGPGRLKVMLDDELLGF
jgi:hypothetical protein